MKRYLVLAFLMILFALALSIEAAEPIRPYAQNTTNQVWWLLKKGIKKYEWVDHTGRTNTWQREVASTNNTRTSNQRYGITITPDLQVVQYEVFYGPIVNWDIKDIAPAKYDMVKGPWYYDLDNASKTALWVAYTNSYINAELDRRAKLEAEASAPAKFDVSKTPDEYKADLLGDREYDELMPAEKRALNQELSKYRIEWTRINDPDQWRRLREPMFPGRGDNLTEQQKIRSRSGYRRR